MQAEDLGDVLDEEELSGSIGRISYITFGSVTSFTKTINNVVTVDRKLQFQEIQSIRTRNIDDTSVVNINVAFYCVDYL